MIVVAVMGIIAAIALPSYNEHVRAGRRAAAVSAVGDLALQQERWRAEHTSYAEAGDLTLPEASNYYDYGVAGGATYSVTATPKGKQAGDTCGILTATNTSKAKWATASCNQ